VGSCYLSNPGRANVYQLAQQGGGYYNVKVTNDDFGFTQLKRNYYGLDTYLSHPFDGTWSLKADYLYSRSYGNTEGQVRSDVGQGSVSATRDWDYATLMEYANGDLANDRKHQFKIYGSYQVTPEWMVSANLTVQSGTPKSCLGRYGADESDPSGYGSYYHYCFGVPSRPGDKGRNPWEELVDANVEYRPLWADRKLAFNVSVFNLLNQQRAQALRVIDEWLAADLQTVVAEPRETLDRALDRLRTHPVVHRHLHISPPHSPSLPGFMMPRGSNADLIRRKVSSEAPC